MPRRKEIDLLQELANRVLLNSLVQCCRKLSETNASSLIELKEAVGAMKERIMKHIPTTLMAKFSASFINEFASFVRDELHGRIILEIIMDIEIVGLQLTGRSLRFLQPEDVPRLRKLKELDLSDVRMLHLDLAEFHLHDLTIFKCPEQCTDSYLEIIGRNCPNLEVLDVNASESVTDEGFHFLSSCPNLRVVKVDMCPNVTHVTLSFLLTVHEKLEDFSYGTEVICEVSDVRPLSACFGLLDLQPVFDMLSGLDFTVQCPSLSRFTYENYLERSPTTELKDIVEKFPNLTSFRMKFVRVEDLSVIKQLNKLTELSVIFDGGMVMGIREKTWSSLQKALTVIGANLTSLTLHDSSSLSQDDVNFIYDSCPNLEYLHIDQTTYFYDTFVIPPFPKLKELIFRLPIFSKPWTIGCNQTLIFGNMLSLEILSGENIRMGLEFLESMMLDDVKFPKLRVVKTNSFISEELAEIEQTARDYNLDFSISHALSDRDSNSEYRDEDDDFESSDDWEYWDSSSD